MTMSLDISFFLSVILGEDETPARRPGSSKLFMKIADFQKYNKKFMVQKGERKLFHVRQR